ncbi:MAG: bifunctional oligoribonuclease/PAP phosphatase NrnA [Treponema sp.]|nr:bifunctional oligoribonuclease/PAP phosphatase NrnA [Treponema sp.]
MLISEKQYHNFENFLKNHTHFLIVGHKEPDGDCLTSCMGMAAILKKLNLPYQLLSSGPFKRTEIKKFAKYFSQIIKPEFIQQEKIGVIILDCSEMHRLGDIAEQVINYDNFIIDHHKTSNVPKSKSIVIPSAPASAYLVQLLYEHFVGKPDKKTAEILFLGMCTDTGFFRFLDENSSDFFLAISRLVEAGVNPKYIFTQITNGKPFSTRKLLAIMLEKAELCFGGKLVYTQESLEDTLKFGKNGRDTDSLYSLLLSIGKVEVALFLRQDTPSSCTVGFRSQDSIDVSKIAAKFGGGGHKNAAGLSIEGTITDLLPKLLKEFEKFFKN